MHLKSSKNIENSKSYSWFTTIGANSQLHFLKNIFSKNFSKNPKFRFFQNFEIFDFHWLFFKKSKKCVFLKNRNFGFFEKFFENIFSKNRVWLFGPQKVFGCNFWKNKYFFTNPKAYEAACPWLPFPLLDIKNGPLRKKLSPKNLGGVF